MTIFYADISSYDAGISLNGLLAVSCKATEGVGYTNPDYFRAKQNAADNGVFFFAYHFLHRGDGAGQARYCHGVVGSTPVMLDVEAFNANISDVIAFTNTFRALGGVVHLAYIPHWYWQDTLGSPTLLGLLSMGILIVSSAYEPYDDSDGYGGWAAYGGATPIIWQYADNIQLNGFNVDFNAFRGHYKGKQDAASIQACLAEFKSIVTTGAYPPTPPQPGGTYTGNPVRGLKATPRATQCDLSWDAMETPMAATGYRVRVWNWMHTYYKADIPGTSVTIHNLPRGTKFNVSVLALPATPAATIAGRANITFRTQP